MAWESGELRYELSDNLPNGGNLNSASEAIWEGLSAWNAVGCSRFRFVEAGISASHALAGDGRNTIEWVGIGWAERGFPTDAAAVSDVQYQGTGTDWRIVEADLYLNAEQFLWSPGGDSTKKSIRSVLMHEGGHLLGLEHPCETQVEGSIPACGAEHEGVAMHPIYSDDLVALSGDDQAGICAVYPACDATTCGEHEACTERGCRPLCGETTCEDSEICLENRCASACRSSGCACSSDTDCDSGLGCNGGTCAAGEALAGDPCQAAAECASGNCKAGSCAFPCGTMSDCPGGDDTCELGACTQGTQAFGEECDSASECISGQCLTGVGATPVCTRSCTLDGTACAADWVCGPVGDDMVCQPPTPEPPAESSCAIQPTRQGSRPQFPYSAAVFLTLALGVLRRRFA